MLQKNQTKKLIKVFLCRLLLLSIPSTLTKETPDYMFTLKPIENNVGLYYQRETKLKVSNDKWTLLVYKDVQQLKETFDNNVNILQSIMALLNHKSLTMKYVQVDLRSHLSLLVQISDEIETKFQEIELDVSGNPRKRRGLINAVGSIWKFITGNLDASDGEYYSNCINKIEKDEHEFENLMKKQIMVTTSVIKSFNETLRKLKIDEKTFNQDLKNIETNIHSIWDEIETLEDKFKLMSICERLLESFSFIEGQLNDILNAITFARLNIIHTSIITPKDLVSALEKIAQSLQKNNLPLAPREAKVATYLDIIELSAFQTLDKLIFVLDIPLVEPELYTIYRLYPIPTKDNRTQLHYILPTIQKYIAKSDDSDQFIPLSIIDNCKEVMINIKLCKNLYSYPIDSNSMCEAQLVKTQNFNKLPKNCEVIPMYAQDYKIQLLKNNIWLLIITDQTPVTIKCENIDPISKILETNTIMTLQPRCSAFIGTTKVQASLAKVSKWHYNYTNIVNIPLNCCQSFPNNGHPYLNLKPIKIGELNLDDLEIAKHKLDQYSKEIDDLMNEPFIQKYTPWFTYVSMTLIILVISVCIMKRCRKRRRMIGISVEHSNPPSPPSPRPRISLLGNRFSRILPRRRPSIHINEPVEEGEPFELIENRNTNRVDKTFV